MRQTRFGVPMPRSKSEVTALIVEPSKGLMVQYPPTEVPLGGAVQCENWLLREGTLTPRPTLSSHTSNANPLAGKVLGGVEVQSSTGTRYNLISSTTRLAYYSASSYSPISQTSAGGTAFQGWSGTTYDSADFAQIYEAVNDEMLAFVSTTSSYQTLVCWKAGATVFSVVTQAPRARWIAPFDNFMLAGNIRDAGSAQSKYIQRMQWTDRGNPFSWTPGATSLAGNQDLLDMRGGIQRIIAEESRVVIFSEYEIWTGVRDSFPNTFRFTPLDRTIGTPFGKTCVETPKGIVFMARNFDVYLLPKDGSTAQPIAQNVHAYIRANIANPENAHATYDPVLQAYQLYFPHRAGSTIPQRSLWVDIESGAWSLQRWDLVAAKNITASWTGALSTGQAGLTWSSVSGVYTWATFPGTWASAGPVNDYGNQVTYCGSSDGTVWYLNSAGTSDDGAIPEVVWVSGALGGDSPEKQKNVNGFRVDYQAAAASTISVSFSRDQGATWDSAFTVPLVASDNQTVGRGFPYTQSPYPMFKITSNDRFFDLLRMWVASRQGGR